MKSPLEVNITRGWGKHPIATEALSTYYYPYENQVGAKTFMKNETQSPPLRKSASKKRPLDPREFPLSRDARGSAGREEIRSKTPMVSAPRQSRRPVERSNQKRAHTR